MDSIKIDYYHGHFYNSETKERLVLTEGAKYLLTYSDKASINVEFFQPPVKLRDENEMKDEILSDPNITHIKKIKLQGDLLYFFISNNSLKENNEQLKESWFRIRLLEDLFLYSCKNWKNIELIEKGKLFDCQCVVERSESEELPYFENIYAKSITSAVKITHIHYFGNVGSPSKNSFDSIFLSKNRDKFNSLDVLRRFTEKDITQFTDK